MTEPLSPRNAMVQQARLLARDRNERERTGQAVLEGIRLAEEALLCGVAIDYALYSPSLLNGDRGAALRQRLEGAGVPVHPVTDETLSRTADTESPQGVIGVFRPTVHGVAAIGPGMVVVLDNLQDPGNAGTIIRSLEALGGAAVIVCGGVDPYNPKVIRSAMGSLFRLPVIKCDIAEALDALARRGRTILIADAGGDLQPWTADLSADAVVVIGNEGAGPSETARRMAKGIVSIPMPGPTESLNAGVAAALLIYEGMRQRATGR